MKAEQTASAHLIRNGIAIKNFAIPGDDLAAYEKRLQMALWQSGKCRGILFLLYDNDLIAAERITSGVKRPVASPLTLRQALLRFHFVRLISRGFDYCGLSDTVATHTGYTESLKVILARDLRLHQKGYLAEDSFSLTIKKLQSLIQQASSITENVWGVPHLAGVCRRRPAQQKILGVVGGGFTRL